MSKTIIQFALLFVLLVMVQAVIFSHIALFSVAMAFVFIYFIIKLPLSLSPARVIFLSFLIGFVLDIFQDTPGVNSLSCTCLGAVRRTVIRLYIPREEDLIRAVPSIRTLGAALFAKYAATMVLIYSILVFSIEAFTFFHPAVWGMRIVCTAVLTTLLIMAFDSLSLHSDSEKRL